MVRECVLCKRLDIPNQGVSFHRLPSDLVNRNIWISLLGIEKQKLRKYPVVCSVHFDPQDILCSIDGRKKYLKPGSVPKKSQSIIWSESSDSTTSESPARNERTVPYNLFKKKVESPHKSLLDIKKEKLHVPQDVFISEVETCTAGPSGFNGSSYKKSELNVSCSQSSSSVTATASETEEMVNKSQPIGQKPRFATKCKKRRYPGDLESSDFSTPEKRRRNLRMLKEDLAAKNRKIKCLQQSVRRLKSKVTTLKDLLQQLKDKKLISEGSESSIKASLSGVSKDVFERMLQGPTRQKYKESLRSFALTLSFYSPKAYTYVRETFNKSLPDLSTISKWFRSIDGGPGFTQEALTALKLKKQEGIGELLCNLTFDEMSIRKMVEWTGKKFSGYVDVGTNINSDSLEEAREVLVFLVTSLTASWKVPVGYFFIDGLTATEKSGLVKKCLEFLHDEGCGIKITSLTFDGPPTNFHVAKQLGADFSDEKKLKTSFSHPKTKEPVFIILDPCHMIKLVRNCMASVDNLRDLNMNEIKWDYIEKLVEKQQNEGLHAANKLKLRHIHWKREKMKVRLATQTLSKSVSDAIIFLREDLRSPEFEGSEGTSTFIKKFNDIFDILNSRNLFAKYVYKRPFSPKTEDLFNECFDDMQRYILGLTINNVSAIKTQRKTGFLGILICIQSIREMYKVYVKEKMVLKYLMTYKLSQDHLEIFFSVIRSRGGYNNNPSARQFEAAYKRLLIHSQLKASKNANAIDLNNLTILTCGSGKILNINERQNLEDAQDYKLLMNDIKKRVEDCLTIENKLGNILTSYLEDIVIYIAGFVVKSSKKIITCHKCLSLLESDASESRLQQRKTYGKLVKASPLVIYTCREAEKYFRIFNKTANIFNKNIESLLGTLVINTLNPDFLKITYEYFGDHLFDNNIFDSHAIELVKLILKKYYTLRLHHETNKKVDLSLVNRFRSLNTKSVLFRNE